MIDDYLRRHTGDVIERAACVFVVFQNHSCHGVFVSSGGVLRTSESACNAVNFSSRTGGGGRERVNDALMLLSPFIGRVSTPLGSGRGSRHSG